jgi:translation elongation factor EF-1alpha
VTCPVYPIPQVKRFIAQICLNEIKHPVIPGSKYNFHFGLMTQLGTIKKLNFSYKSAKFNKISQKKPRLLKSSSYAEVLIKLDKRTSMEIFENFKSYGTFQFSNEFDTLGYGKVIKLVK